MTLWLWFYVCMFNLMGFYGLSLCLLSFSGDVISSTITFSKPRMDLPAVPEGHLDFPFNIPRCQIISLQELDIASLAIEMHTLIQSISELASHFLEHYSLVSSTAVVIYYTQVISAIEHRLLSFQIQYSSTQPADIAVLYVIEMSRIAALISTTYYFRGISITSATISSLQKRLISTSSTLESIHHDFLDESSLKLPLWACWLGGLTANDQEWFAARIQGYMTWLQLRSQEELESFLEGYILAPRRHDSHGSALWQQILKSPT